MACISAVQHFTCQFLASHVQALHNLSMFHGEITSFLNTQMHPWPFQLSILGLSWIANSHKGKTAVSKWKFQWNTWHKTVEHLSIFFSSVFMNADEMYWMAMFKPSILGWSESGRVDNPHTAPSCRSFVSLKQHHNLSQCVQQSYSCELKKESNAESCPGSHKCG